MALPSTVFTAGDFIRRVVDSLLHGDHRGQFLCARCLVKLAKDNLDRSYMKPDIARVMDAGATPDGRPYFVMELIHGVPITINGKSRRLRSTCEICGMRPNSASNPERRYAIAPRRGRGSIISMIGQPSRCAISAPTLRVCPPREKVMTIAGFTRLSSPD